MARKKATDCPKVLGGCGTLCVEVGRAIGYPKKSQDTLPNGRHGNEYRYTCPNCGKEWIHDTFARVVWEIKSAQCHVRLVNEKEIIRTRDPYLLKHWGLNPDKAVQLTSEEIMNLKAKKSKGVV